MASSTQGLRGLAWLLVLQSAGELLARGLSLPFPGPVVGMVLLLGALRWPLVREPVAACADYLLQHLSLLFVPDSLGATGFQPRGRCRHEMAGDEAPGFHLGQLRFLDTAAVEDLGTARAEIAAQGGIGG